MLPQPRSPTDMRQDVAEWCKVNEDWLTKVTDGWVESRAQLELYVDSLVTQGYVVDEIGMLIISRVYRLKLAVLFNKVFWTCLADGKLETCEDFLACTGRYQFSLTRPKPPEELTNQPSLKRKSEVAAQAAGEPPEGQLRHKYRCREVRVSMEDLRDIVARSEQMKAERQAKAAWEVKFNNNLESKRCAIRLKNAKWRKGRSTVRHYIRVVHRRKLFLHPKPVLKKHDIESKPPKPLPAKPSSKHVNVHTCMTGRKPKRFAPTPPPPASPAESASYREKLRGQKKDKKGKVNTSPKKRKLASTKDTPPYKCSIGKCRVSCDTKRQLYKHIALKHPSFRYKCVHCKKEYMSKFGLDKHLRHHLGRQHHCTFCNMQFFEAHELKEHLRLHRGSDLTCDTCGQTTTTKRAMKRHMFTHSEKKLKCKYCHFKCVTPASLYQHERRHTSKMKCACGHEVQWYLQKKKHEMNCKKCKRLIAKEAKKTTAICNKLKKKQN